MKFQNINKARLDINEVVYTKDADGNFGMGRLKEEKRNENGTIRVFTMASFEGDPVESSEIREVRKFPIKKEKPAPIPKVKGGGK